MPAVQHDEAGYYGLVWDLVSPYIPMVEIASERERGAEAYLMFGVGIPPSSVPVTATAAAVDGTTVDVTFDRAVFDTVLLRTAASYTITTPLGLPAVSVTGAAFVAPATVRLTLSGVMLNTGAYSVNTTENVTRATDDGGGHVAAAVAFVAIYSAPSVVSVRGVTPPPATDATKIRVVFDRDMQMDAAVGGALRLANYSVAKVSDASPLAISSITSIGAREIEINTDPQVALAEYSLSYNSIKDLAGNEVA